MLALNGYALALDHCILAKPRPAWASFYPMKFGSSQTIFGSFPNEFASGTLWIEVLSTTFAAQSTVFTGATSTRYLQITLNPGAAQEILAPRQLITACGAVP